MKRVVLLVVVLGLCLAGIAISLVVLPGTGPQLALRLQNAWEAGELKAEAPRMSDIDTVTFPRIEMRSAAVLPGGRRNELVLNEVAWQRGTLFTFGRKLPIGNSTVRFDSGRLSLELDGKWGASVMWPGLDDKEDWLTQLPKEIRGSRLQMQVRGGSEAEPIEFETTVVDPRFSQDGVGGGSLRAELESDLWGSGYIDWAFRSAGSRFRMHIDDVDLSGFPFIELSRLLAFPWPLDLVNLVGRADLDWMLDAARPTLTLDHYQLALPAADLPHRLHYLTGRAVFSPEHVEWTVHSGRYSQSRFSAELHVERETLRVTGTTNVRDVLGDRGIGAGLPDGWRVLVEHIPLSGKCDLAGTLDGYLGLRAREILQELKLQFTGVELRTTRGATAGRGLVGEMTLTPVTGGWTLSGNTERSTIHGFELLPSRWAGTIDGRGLRLRRVSDDGPRIEIECALRDQDTPHFTLYMERFDLSSWLHRDVGPAAASLHLSGQWDLNRGFSYEGWCNWDGMVIPDEVTWPVRRPQGDLSGQILFRRHRGQNYLPSIAVQDSQGTWVAQGWIDPQQQWVLDGVGADRLGPLPAPLDIPHLVEDPRGGWRPFALKGVLLGWGARE